jgi:hypothetical protein
MQRPFKTHGTKRSLRPYEPVPDRKSYERQPRESDWEFITFVTYRDMGLNRTQKRVAEFLYKARGVTLQTCISQVARFSAKWNWTARINEWDRDLDRANQKAQIEDLKKMRARHIDISMAAQNAAAQDLKRWVKKLKPVLDENGNEIYQDPILPLPTVMQIMKDAVALERTSRGEPETITEHRENYTVTERRENLRRLVVDEQTLDSLDAALDRAYQKSLDKEIVIYKELPEHVENVEIDVSN